MISLELWTFPVEVSDASFRKDVTTNLTMPDRLDSCFYNLNSYSLDDRSFRVGSLSSVTHLGLLIKKIGHLVYASLKQSLSSIINDDKAALHRSGLV